MTDWRPIETFLEISQQADVILYLPPIGRLPASYRIYPPRHRTIIDEISRDHATHWSLLTPPAAS